MTVGGDAAQEERVDFFLSYTGADVAWAEWTAAVLEKAGHTTILQAWDFRPGSNFVLNMHDALRRSDRVIALLSEPYLRSAYAAPEWAAAFVGDPEGRSRRLLPVRVGDCQPDGLLEAVVYVDLVGTEEPEARRRLLGVVTDRARPTSVPFPGAASAPFPGRLPDIWKVPARNPNFAGRDRELGRLRSALGEGPAAVAVLAVAGLGGVGKTQLAIEHAWRRAADYDLVWWLAAELPATIASSFTPLAESLGVATDDPKAVVGLVHAELGRRWRWLVVFDNAEDLGSVGPYLPPGGGGGVLVTSRNPAWKGVGATLDLDVWLEAEAVAFLLARTGGDDEEAARAVATDLGLLPLALEQAGAYIEETGMALDAYRDLLSSRRGDMLERGTPAFYRQTVAATFGLAYDRAAEQSPVAARVLGSAAVLAPDDIPVELVTRGDPLADEDAIGVLRRLGLVRRQADSLSLHRLVAAVVRDRLGDGESARLATAVLAALAGDFPDLPEDHRTWPQCARLLPHVLAVADHVGQKPELGVLLNRAGIYLRSQAQLGSAREILERALRIEEAAYGPDHPAVARTLGNLGNVLHILGELAAAREHQQRALRIEEAAYGPDHPEVARTLSNLGIVLRDLGELPAAREHQQRALQVNEAAYGPDHPEVASTLGNLGNVLHDLGELPAAREHQQRALRIFEATYGPDHPKVALALTNLGNVLQILGELPAAREHQERALRINEAAYGPDHPEVALTLTNLGNVLQDLRELPAAREHHQRALRIDETAYGPDHPHVAVTLYNLGILLQDLGELPAAREQVQRAVRIFEAAYGPDHSHTKTARRALDDL